jgi:hypothetical protein
MKDFCLDNNQVFVSDERDLIVQQIDMLFDTTIDEVLGERYGSHFYDFLWDLNATASDISEYTKSIIAGHVVLFGWSVDVDTQLLQGTQNDIILITVKLTKYDETIEKTYKVD